MIRARLHLGNEKKPFKAFREENTSRELAQKIYMEIFAAEDDVRVVMDELIKGYQHSMIIEREFIEANRLIKNGPIIARLMQTFQAFNNGPDLVQKRVQEGGY